MRTAILLHGTGGSDQDYFWFGDTKQYLEANGYQVWWPLLPHTEKPELVESRNFVEQTLPSIDEETIIIGHSSACPLILHMLQYFRVRVKQVILVGGFYQPLSDNDSSALMLPVSFDWQFIKTNASEIIFINSDNDPWGCDDKQARPVAEKLGAKFIFAAGQGHMGSGTYDQPYREFPKLKALLCV